MKDQSYSTYVLDSSAIIALIKKEKGVELVSANIKGAIMSSVNYAETLAVLVRKLSPEIAVSILSKLISEIVEFDEAMAVQTAILYQQTKKYGLSFGDRACIALGLAKGMNILTADKIWTKLDLNITIKYIRD
jgi:ribonuclease VapC